MTTTTNDATIKNYREGSGDDNDDSKIKINNSTVKIFSGGKEKSIKINNATMNNFSGGGGGDGDGYDDDNDCEDNNNNKKINAIMQQSKIADESAAS